MTSEATDTPLREQRSARTPLPGLFGGLESGEKKAQRAFEALIVHRYTLMEIAEQLEVHYSTMSRMIRPEGLRRDSLHCNLRLHTQCRCPASGAYT